LFPKNWSIPTHRIHHSLGQGNQGSVGVVEINGFMDISVPKFLLCIFCMKDPLNHLKKRKS
jgi:hypothetical protein